MKPQFRLPLYVALVLVGLLAIVFKRDDPFGMVLGALGIGVGFVAIYQWSQHKPSDQPSEENPSDQNPPAPSA
ncbi:hypothetical protein HYR54_08790 [Candidatus Acetothermia bacterium]|nr:hypothetical protein [Candidatus Acetothermia bacterium]